MSISEAPSVKTDRQVRHQRLGHRGLRLPAAQRQGQDQARAHQRDDLRLSLRGTDINDGSVVKVKVALQPGNGYAVGTPSGAKVKIVDND